LRSQAALHRVEFRSDQFEKLTRHAKALERQIDVAYSATKAAQEHRCLMPPHSRISRSHPELAARWGTDGSAARARIRYVHASAWSNAADDGRNGST
jgi:hypothetical protein